MNTPANAVFLIPNVENRETTCYFNFGNVQLVQQLQASLIAHGCNPTIVAHCPAHQPNNLYYTPKYAVPGRNGWIPSYDQTLLEAHAFTSQPISGP